MCRFSRFSLFWITLFVTGSAVILALAPPRTWWDLWLTGDQQGLVAFHRGDYELAARRFDDLRWRGYAFYLAEEFASAEREFARFYGAQDYFRRANAAAHSRRYFSAIDLYEMALALDPGLEIAGDNLSLVTALAEDDAPGQEDEVEAEIDPRDERAREATPDDQETQPDERSFTLVGDEERQARWLEGLATTPADFLALKFRFQLQQAEEGAP